MKDGAGPVDSTGTSGVTARARPELDEQESGPNLPQQVVSSGTYSSTNSQTLPTPAWKLEDIGNYDTEASLHTIIRNHAACHGSSSANQRFSRKMLRYAYSKPFDRVNVLGDNNGYGHTGCVNALSWGMNGDVLVSGGDDTTVRLWRIDSKDNSTAFPYKETAIINTGHRGNIFNAHILPSSSRIATVAGDGQVRVFDAEHPLLSTVASTSAKFAESQVCTRVLKCHKKRTKRIITEESPDMFLTVAEDGAVIQHDLRTTHQCSRDRGTCPPPLVKLPFDLSTIALSPLAPYLFVVGGESTYAYLFDRRQVGRSLQAEWGMKCDEESYVTCVRRFGRQEREQRGRVWSDHITGARMAQTNSHEVLLSYSADAVYLYSTRDEPEEGTPASSVLPANKKRKRSGRVEESSSDSGNSTEDNNSSVNEIQGDAFTDLLDFVMSEGGSDDSSNDSSDDDDYDGPPVLRPLRVDKKFRTPIVLPRREYRGHCNVDTIKDVNFIGIDDEFVASGSDDGNFFLWQKDTGRLHGIYEGDGSVVNVIENHPRLPLIACSGIDTTVKLFAPTNKESVYSRFKNAEEIVKQNATPSSHIGPSQAEFARLLLQYRATVAHRLRRGGDDNEEGGEEEERDECTFQ